MHTHNASAHTHNTGAYTHNTGAHTHNAGAHTYNARTSNMKEPRNIKIYLHIECSQPPPPKPKTINK